MKITSRAGRVTAAFLIGCLMLPQSLWAQDPSAMAREGAVDENPHWGAMVGDFFVARPLGLVMTVGGTALWLVSLPFTLLAGNANEAADTLILGPGEQTFMRCLGCRKAGYTNKDIEQHQKRQTAQVDE